MDKEQLQKVGLALAVLVSNALAWYEPLDGDATQEIVDSFLRELNSLMGNT